LVLLSPQQGTSSHHHAPLVVLELIPGQESAGALVLLSTLESSVL
jgi:hypothetical protein